MIAGKVHVLETNTWVNTHNLFIILARLWSWISPVQDLHYDLNLLCGLFGALAVHFMFLCSWRLTHNLPASICGALAITVSHSLWWHSTMLEVYTLNMALMAMILYKVVCFEQTGDAQQLYQATFAWGLSLLNHILMGLFLPAFIALLFFGKHKRTVAKPRVFGLLLFFFFCSFQLYCYLFLKEFSQQASAYYPLDFDKALDIFLQMAHNTT
ncbi:MAG: protein O-mannosyl-transferase family, partial [Bdellovibrionota bacterium]